ncbi:hypothetical protein ACFLZJ_01570 [Nanoarchaeota archaeon]
MLWKKRDKAGQVWIETVIYTLIAFVMIGLVLTFVKPEIEELQDKAVLEQTLVVMEDIDNTILSIKEVQGNKRLIELGIKEGSLKIDGENDTIFFEMESKHAFSQEGEPLDYGGVIVITQSIGDYNRIRLINNYTEEYNITFDGKDSPRTISKSPIPYSLSIANQGEDAAGKIVIDLEIN